MKQNHLWSPDSLSLLLLFLILLLPTFADTARAQSLPVPVSMPAPLQAAVTKTAANISVGAFFRLPRYSQMSISPDGKRLATLAFAQSDTGLSTYYSLSAANR